MAHSSASWPVVAPLLVFLAGISVGVHSRIVARKPVEPDRSPR